MKIRAQRDPKNTRNDRSWLRLANVDFLNVESLSVRVVFHFDNLANAKIQSAVQRLVHVKSWRSRCGRLLLLLLALSLGFRLLALACGKKL